MNRILVGWTGLEKGHSKQRAQDGCGKVQVMPEGQKSIWRDCREVGKVKKKMYAGNMIWVLEAFPMLDFRGLYLIQSL